MARARAKAYQLGYPKHRRVRWTDAEDERLIDAWEQRPEDIGPKTFDRDLSAAMGRTPTSVARRRAELSLVSYNRVNDICDADNRAATIRLGEAIKALMERRATEMVA